jgi:hypothetical protein
VANVKRMELKKLGSEPDPTPPEDVFARRGGSTTAMTIVIQQISTQESSRYGEKLGDKGKELRVAIVVRITAVLINGTGLD